MAEIPVINAEKIADKTLSNLAKDPNVNLSQASAADIKTEVIRETSAVIMNQTNQEPWYQSRVTWGAIIAMVAGVASITGYSFSQEDQEFWINNISQVIQLGSAAAGVVGGAYAWYGRWRAKKAIGQ